MTHSPRKRTASIGGATYDLFVRTPQGLLKQIDGKDVVALALGSKARVEDVKGLCGGGASNTSVGLARLGCTAHYAGILADDQWGGLLRENFSHEGVGLSMMTTVANETSSFSIILIPGTGERTILYSTGTNAHLHDVTFDRDAAATMDWLFFNHINLQSRVIEDDLIAMLQKEPHAGLSWNPGGRQIEAGIHEQSNSEILKHTSLLLLNKEEALAFSGTKTLKEALKTLSDTGAQAVCITDGKHGSWATDGTTVYFCEAPESPVVDTTGAGDALGPV